MLPSLGIDIIEVDRIRQALRRRPQLAARLFTGRERLYCDRRADPALHYAARFAAKEATAKAVGRWLRWHDVEVLNERSGRPLLRLSGEAATLAQVARGARLLVSLSHSRDYAVACVLLLAPPLDSARGGALVVPRGGAEPVEVPQETLAPQEIAGLDQNLPPGEGRLPGCQRA